MGDRAIRRTESSQQRGCCKGIEEEYKFWKFKVDGMIELNVIFNGTREYGPQLSQDRVVCHNRLCTMTK
jgi:hypothetical protein